MPILGEEGAGIRGVGDSRYKGKEVLKGPRLRAQGVRERWPSSPEIKSSQFMTVMLFCNCRLFCLTPRTNAGTESLLHELPATQEEFLF
jgi:hypothetical protein